MCYWVLVKHANARVTEDLFLQSRPDRWEGKDKEGGRGWEREGMLGAGVANPVNFIFLACASRVCVQVARDFPGFGSWGVFLIEVISL